MMGRSSQTKTKNMGRSSQTKTSSGGGDEPNEAPDGGELSDDDEPISWAFGVQRAQDLLNSERESGTSYGWQYLGGSAGVGLRFRIAPGGALWWAQLLLHGIISPLNDAFLMRAFGFSLTVQAAHFMLRINIYLKGIVYRGELIPDDNEIFMFMRSLPSARRAQFALPMNTNPAVLMAIYAYGVIGLILLSSYIAAMWGYYVYEFSNLDAAGHVSFYAFWALEIFSPIAPGYFTHIYSTVAIELERAIRERVIWPRREDLGTIDFNEVHANYDFMKSALEGFTLAFRRFFFIAEFSLFLAFIVQTFGVLDQLGIWEADRTIVNAVRLGFAACIWLWELNIIAGLVTKAAFITDAAQALAPRALTLSGQVASHAPTLKKDAKYFHQMLDAEHKTIVSATAIGWWNTSDQPIVQACRICLPCSTINALTIGPVGPSLWLCRAHQGFTYFGIVIDSNLIARVIYAATSAGFTFGSWLMQGGDPSEITDVLMGR